MNDSLFKEQATRDSIERFPFFSGLMLAYRGLFHESFNLEVPLAELKISSEFMAVAVEKGLVSLKDLLMLDYTEFVFHRNIDKGTVEQVKRVIIDHILLSNQSEENRGPAEQIIVTSHEDLSRCRFFSENSNHYFRSTELRSISVFSLDFLVRFRNSLKRLNYISNLEGLLNTDAQDFLKLRNCGRKTIEDARNAILDFLFNNLSKKHYSMEISPLISSLTRGQNLVKDQITFSPFFSGGKHFRVESSKLKEVNIYALDFPVRFYNALKSLKEIHTLDELLNTDPQQFLRLRNCGRKSIEIARAVILDFLKSETRSESYSLRTHEEIQGRVVEERFLDLRLTETLLRTLKSERNLRILLLRFGYEGGDGLTLEEIGDKFGLTRERIRQILVQIKRKIIKSKYALEEVCSLAKQMDYVMAITTFVDKLKNSGVWGQSNPNFLATLLSEFLGTKHGLILEDGYLINSEAQKIETYLKRTNTETVKILTSIKNGIMVTDLLSILNEKLCYQDIDSKRILTRDTIFYLAKKFGSFHACDENICNEMTYQIECGKYLKDIIYHSLKYLNERSHFAVLAEFIRAHNQKYRDVENTVVHSTLQRMEYCHNVDRGVYALKEWNIPRHVSAGDALVKLLHERGPLLEEDIIDKLSQNYSLWNVKMALENNRHKLIKIGNNLLDLKRRLYESNRH